MILSIHEPDFWEERYQQGTTGWDLGPTFRRYLSQFNFQLNCSK